MSLVTTTMTSKGQATIPANVRKKLNLKPGDKITFKVEAEKVLISKEPAIDLEYLKALENTLDEWHSESDNQAYNDL